MTQPAKVQEPSMEEILASIRRIIADDEAKPAEVKPVDAKSVEAKPVDTKLADAKPVARPEPPKPQVVAVKPPIPATSSVRPTPSVVKPTPVAAPAAAASNSQDDIDAMLAGMGDDDSLAGIRPSLPDGDVFELTDDMAIPDTAAQPFSKVDPQDDLEFSENASRFRQPAFTPPPMPPVPDLAAQLAPNILSRSTVSAVESAFNSLANTVLSNNARTLEDLVKEMLRPMLKTWLDDNLPGVVERIVKTEIERVSRGR